MGRRLDMKAHMKADFLVQSQADSLTLFGRHWPAENPRAVMSLVHGFGEHSGRYEHMAKHLNAAGISVLAVDLRGHGRTDSPRGVCKDYAHLTADVDRLLAESKTLYPNLPHYLFGHSMGGGLVLHHGLTDTSQTLAGYLVSAPLILPKDPVPAPLRLLAKFMRHIMPKGSLPNPISGDKISTLPSEQADYEADGLNHDRLGFGLAVGILGAGEHAQANAAQWNKPLRLWHAKKDQLTEFKASEAFAKLSQNCEFTAFENVEHEMHNDTCRNDVYALMLDFMGRQIS